MTDLMQQLSEASGMAEPLIWQAALVFVRVGAMVGLLPALGEQMVPLRIKLAAAVCLTMVVLPTLPSFQEATLSALLAEAVCGLILGFGLRLLVLGLQMAGTIAAQSTSLSQMFAGTGPDPQPVIGNLLVLAGIAIFVSMDGLSRSAELIILSYDLMPAGELPLASDAAEWDLARISAVFALAFTLAAPFVLAALLYNLALGAINRAMPQLMVSLVGAPALALGGIALMVITAPILLAVWRDAVDAALSQPLGF